MPLHKRPRRFTREERDLGLDADITRRDFLDATLLATGAALLRTPAPLRRGPASRDNPAWEGFAGTGDYARSHGNMWDMMTVAHQLRDGRFARAAERAIDSGETYDLIVVGGGLSGLGAAYFHQKTRPGRVLVLDNHPMVGGEAKRNELDIDGVHLIGPQGSNDFGTSLPAGWAGEYWRDLGLPHGVDAFEHQRWAPGVPPLAIARDHYYFQLWADQFASHGYFFPNPDGSLRLVHDAFGEGLTATPWPAALRRDFIRWRTETAAAPRDLNRARWLDGMTYEDLLVKVMGLDPSVARYADPILAGAAGGLGSDVISAQCAAQIGLPGTGRVVSHRLEDTLPFGSSFPGGNDGIMRHVLRTLVPEAIEGARDFAGIMNGRIRFEALDRSASPTRIRLGATVVRVANLIGGDVEVIYAKGDQIYRARARGAVMANGAWSSRHIVADVPASHREAFADFVRAPMLVVNVGLRRWRFMYDIGLTAASYRDRFGFCCNVRQSMVVGDYRPPLDPDRPTLLTFYVPFERPGAPLQAQAIGARTELLATSYRDFERRIREQLARLFGRAGFDARRDVAGIVLNRWGHAYVCPAPGFYFGRDGKPAAPEVLKQPVGRVAFANAELNGHQNWLDATAHGKRAVEQLIG